MQQADPGSDLEPDRTTILILSVVTFIGCVVLSHLGCWMAGIDLAGMLTFSPHSLLMGLLTSVPMLVMLAFVRFAPFEWSRRLWETPSRVLGDGLTRLSILDVASVALMAGVGEELLFRGFLQEWLTSYGLLWGLVIPNVLFGLLHAMTLAYAVGACLVGLCFSCLLHFSPEIDLTSLMTAHATYDFMAWVWLAHNQRNSQHRRTSQPSRHGS